MVRKHHHYYFIPLVSLLVFPLVFPLVLFIPYVFLPTVYLQLVSFLACTFCFSTKKDTSRVNGTIFKYIDNNDNYR